MNSDRTYANGSGKHSYDVVVYADKECRVTKNFNTKTFEVHANNRDQAARRVERDGYEVYSINMVG